MTEPLDELAAFLIAHARRGVGVAAEPQHSGACFPRIAANAANPGLAEQEILLLLKEEGLDEAAKLRGLFQIAEQAGLLSDAAFRAEWVPPGG